MKFYKNLKLSDVNESLSDYHELFIIDFEKIDSHLVKFKNELICYNFLLKWNLGIISDSRYRFLCFKFFYDLEDAIKKDTRSE